MAETAAKIQKLLVDMTETAEEIRRLTESEAAEEEAGAL